MSSTGAARSMAAAIACGLLLAFPVRAFLTSADVPLLLKVVWWGLPVVGLMRPVWSAAMIVALVPLLPIWPLLVGRVPLGIVHLAVIGLALPTLVRMARGRGLPTGDVIGPALALVTAVGLASLASWLGAYVRASPAPFDAFGDVTRLLDAYVFVQAGPHLAGGAVAATAFADGLLAYLVIRLAAVREAVPRLVDVAAATAVVVSIVGIAQWLTGAALQPIWLQFDAGIVRINSTYSDPNALGAYLALMLPVTTALAGAAADDTRRWCWLSAAAVLGMALIMTAGRMAVGAAGLGLAAVAAHAHVLELPARDRWRIVRVGFRPIILTVGAVVAAVVVILTVVGTARDSRHADQDSYLDTALYTLNLRLPLDEKLKGRLTFWQSAGQMAADHPGFGVGIGRIFEAFPAYSERTGGLGAGLSLSAHNTFLNVLAELGIVGLLSWLAYLALVYATAYGRGADDDATAWRRVGLAAGLAAYGLTMVTGDRTVLREDLVLFAGVCGLAAALGPGIFGWAPAVRRAIGGAAIVLAITVPIRVVADASRPALEQIEYGLHAPEFDPGGRRFRWTEDRAVLHVAGGTGRLTLPVRKLAPWPVTVSVRVDGRPADRTVLTDQDWHVLRYALTGSASRFHRIELAVSPVDVPPGDRRRLGVMLGTYEWTDDP